MKPSIKCTPQLPYLVKLTIEPGQALYLFTIEEAQELAQQLQTAIADTEKDAALRRHLKTLRDWRDNGPIGSELFDALDWALRELAQ